MAYLSKRDIEMFGEAVLADYSMMNLDRYGFPFNITRFANVYLGLNVKFRKLSDDGSVLGLTAYKGNDHHKLIIDPETAPIVRRMFEILADNEKVSAVAKWLNDSEIPPPRHYFHSIGLATEKEADGIRHWNKGVVYQLLKSRVYCGDMVQGKYRTRSYVQEKLPESEWITVENTHEAIVSRELFDRVQELRAKAPQPLKNQYSDRRTPNIFLRKVFCGHCGHAMFRIRTGKEQYRIKCNTQLMYDKTDCVLVSINESTMKTMLVDMLRKLDYTAPADGAVYDDSDLKAVQSEIEKNSRFLKGLFESYMDADISGGEFKEMKAAYQSKLAALESREKELKDAAYRHVSQQTAYSKALSSVQGINGATDLTADVVGRLIDKIRVFQDGSIEVKFSFMDDVMVGGEVSGDE